MADKLLHRPLIGLTTAEIGHHRLGEPPLWGVRSSYCAPLLACQATPVLLPQIQLISELGNLVDELDGLFLPDGTDIDPALYNNPEEDKLEIVDRVRDQTETALIRWALQSKVPILAISRGMHMVNVVADGTLYQDIPSDLNLPTEHRKQPVAYANLVHHGHLIRLEPNSYLQQLAGHEEIWVNSMHHQAIKKLGANLKIVARSADQIIEAIESSDPDQWLMGLQSHPEAMLIERWAQRLFEVFVQAARDYHGEHHH